MTRAEKMGKMERMLTAAKHVGNLAGHVIPMLAKDDLDKHMQYVLDNNGKVRSYVERSPNYRELLQDVTTEVYGEYHKYLAGARLIDTWDRVTSTIGGLSEVIPGVGQAFSLGEEVVEVLPKIAYSAWYAKGTGDYTALPIFAATELSSAIPFIGDAIDFSNTYVNRGNKKMRKVIAERFLERVKAA